MARSDEAWGHRKVAGSKVEVVLDERPSVFGIAARDWEDLDERGEPTPSVYGTLGALRAEAPDYPRIIPSVALLEAAAKRFDDRLVASLDLLAERGWNPSVEGKAALLARLQTALAERTSNDSAAPTEAAARLAAARLLGGSASKVPDALRPRVEALIRWFEEEPHRSKPTGFYTWSPELSRIFRQDRFLQDAPDVAEPEGAWVRAAAKAVAADPGMEGAYRALVTLAATLTNRLEVRSLLDVPSSPKGRAAVLPASRSHESDLLRKLYGQRSVPDGHVFMDDFVEAIRNGTIDLSPAPASGWYEWQTWALEPLIRPVAALEARKLVRDESYERHCEEVFRAMLTQKRDTHVKQLTGPYIGAAMATVRVTPRLTIEPQVALFRRTADGYAFLREELEKLIGRDVLEAERLYSRDGARDETILGALIGMERRFRSLAALSASEIGADCALVGVAEPEALRLAAEARAELSKWPSAEDLFHDPRVMVPIGYDVERREVRCWAVVGLSSRDLVIEYEKPPAVVSPRAGVQIIFDRGVARVPYEVWIECSLKEPLDREELRALCDRCGTLAEIKAALGAVN